MAEIPWPLIRIQLPPIASNSQEWLMPEELLSWHEKMLPMWNLESCLEQTCDTHLFFKEA